jgi:hypothetical protein
MFYLDEFSIVNVLLVVCVDCSNLAREKEHDDDDDDNDDDDDEEEEREHEKNENGSFHIDSTASFFSIVLFFWRKEEMQEKKNPSCVYDSLLIFLSNFRLLSTLFTIYWAHSFCSHV